MSDPEHRIDTEAEAHMGDEEVITVLRTWDLKRRSRALSQLIALHRASSRRAWRQRHPDEDPRLMDVAWAEAMYGATIGQALRRHVLRES